MGLEEHRFFDLVRQGRAGEVLAEAGFQTDKSELFPIPTAEIAGQRAVDPKSWILMFKQNTLWLVGLWRWLRLWRRPVQNAAETCLPFHG